MRISERIELIIARFNNKDRHIATYNAVKDRIQRKKSADLVATMLSREKSHPR